ncbi:MAG TPA: tripartite tricarboxylate transporter TctB family protein [Usitatibacter sp.]|nr:tripartite tricarboxylate transporter TctB family protein [Usitatibacter sp.]
MRRLVTQYSRDYYGGALMMLIGLGAAFQGSTYTIGTLSRMGPGFFPTALGVILALLGAAIALGARRAPVDAPAEKPLPPEWRGWGCIIASVVAFIVIARWGGFVPATFAITFISAMGDRENTVAGATLLSAAMVAVCIVVFWWALKMPFALFTWGGS